MSKSTNLIRLIPLIAASLLTLSTGLLTACDHPSPSASTPAAQTVVLKVGNQKGSIKALMTAAGVLKDAPYTVEWSEFPAAQHLLEGLNAGAVDVGLVGDAPYLFAFEHGSKLQAVGAVAYGDGSSTALIVPAKSPIRTVADLKGKRIATGNISIGHYLLLRALEEAHLTPKDVQIVFLAPSDAKAALASGSVDAWSTWSPFLTTAVVQDHARVIVSGKGLLKSHGYQVATPAAIQTKQAQLKDFLARLDKAYAWGNAHPKDYAAALSHDTGLPPDIALRMVTETHPVSAPLNDKIVAEADDILHHLSAASDEPVTQRPVNDAFAANFKVAGDQ